MVSSVKIEINLIKMEEDKIRQQARKLINEKYPYLPLKEWGYFEDMFINGWNEALIIQRVSQQRELLKFFIETQASELFKTETGFKWREDMIEETIKNFNRG